MSLYTKFTEPFGVNCVLFQPGRTTGNYLKINMLNQAAYLCPHDPDILIAQIRDLDKPVTASFCSLGCL